MRTKSKSEVSQCKERIQALLRAIVIKRDGGCFLRLYPLAGKCGDRKKNGELVLQADHLVSRERSAIYADSRNVVGICRRHHLRWKPKNGLLYADFVRDFVGEKRWGWIEKAQADTKTHRMYLQDWLNLEIALKQELEQVVPYEERQVEERRTAQQNKALHLWFRIVAEALNAAGYDLVKTIKVMREGVEIPWTEIMIKEILWREVQETMYGKRSTRELLKKEEIDRIYETLNRFLGERLKVENVPFPSEEQLSYSLLEK